MIVGIVVAIHMVGLLMALRVLMLGRTAQGTVAWMLSLILLPYFALPLYGFFSHGKFRGYVIARRARGAQLANLLKRVTEAIASAQAFCGASRSTELAALERLAGLPFTRGNSARLLVDGSSLFEDMLGGIRAARHYILVEFYVLRDDHLGRELQEVLLERAAAGVCVRVLYDDIGSETLTRSYVERLRAGGITISAFNGGKSWFVRHSRINYRNHRKLVVVDGTTGWVGGFNVGDEYVDRDPILKPWRDTHVRVAGPSVLCCQIAFAEDWYWATGEVPDLRWEIELQTAEDRLVLVLPTGPADELETCGLAFGQMIASARRRVWIASPYFVPDSATVSALALAAVRGADVRILLPGKPDHRLSWLAGLSYIPELTRAGVKIYLYDRGVLHQKVALFDDKLSTVGTANFDNRSFRINFELTLAFLDEDFARQVAEMLEGDMACARRVPHRMLEGQPLPFRIAVQACRLLAPVL